MLQDPATEPSDKEHFALFVFTPDTVWTLPRRMGSVTPERISPRELDIQPVD
jgi:hypothetical protein